MDLKRIGALLGLLWVVLKTVLFNLNVDPDTSFNIGVSVNLLLLLIVIFLAVRMHFKSAVRTLFLDNVKAGMKQAAIYVVIVSGFIFIHYRWIDPQFLPHKIETRVEAAVERIESQGGWGQFKENANDERLDQITYDDYLDDMRDSGQTFLNPAMALLIALVSLMSLSFLYTLALSALYRKVLYRFDN